MLRRLRIILASVVFVALTLLFLDISGVLKHYLAFLAKVQFVPAILALNLLPVAIILLVTWLFGRIYCSILCPLGIYQDAISHLRRKKNRFRYKKPRKILRYVFLAVGIALLIAPVSYGVVLLEPYSTFGLILTNIFQPIYVTINNLFAALAEHYDSYAFYDRALFLRSLPSLVVALVLWLVITIFALRTGRDYCNTICPVGTLLGLLSHWSLFRIEIDEEKCIGCGKCARNCKTGCIDAKKHEIDHSRCVDCFNCVENCSVGAISIKSHTSPASPTPPALSERTLNKRLTHEPDNTPQAPSRRTFLIATALLGTTALSAKTKRLEGGLLPLTPKKPAKKTLPLTPPGSASIKSFYDHCVTCQLCITACPNNVLRPSSSLAHFMQPEMVFDKGYCRPECTKCSEVCPTGSIVKITPAEKTRYKIGTAAVDYDLCVASAKGTSCGNCARHCPVGAIRLIKREGSEERIPVVIEERCIGCGACEHLCPVSPLSAIVVQGVNDHIRS